MAPSHLWQGLNRSIAKHGERSPVSRRSCCRSATKQSPQGRRKPTERRRCGGGSKSLLCPLVSSPPHRHGAAADGPPARPLHWRGLEGAVPRAPPPRRQPGHRGHHRFVPALPLSPIALTAYLQQPSKHLLNLTFLLLWW
jgi:hypothetical protein